MTVTFAVAVSAFCKMKLFRSRCVELPGAETAVTAVVLFEVPSCSPGVVVVPDKST